MPTRVEQLGRRRSAAPTREHLAIDPAMKTFNHPVAATDPVRHQRPATAPSQSDSDSPPIRRQGQRLPRGRTRDLVQHIVTPVEFTATEAGFKDGMGGASNAADTPDYHYVLFGRQTDDQHPEFGDVYFEFDDQLNGAVNSVTRVVVAEDRVEFELQQPPKILIQRGTSQTQWRKFVRGIREVFGDDLVHQRQTTRKRAAGKGRLVRQ